MPWKASSVMEERLRFVARLLDGEAMTGACQFDLGRLARAIAASDGRRSIWGVGGDFAQGHLLPGDCMEVRRWSCRSAADW